MAKKDPENIQDKDRQITGEEISPDIEQKNNEDKNAIPTKETKVKNASASGLGTIGRNDETEKIDQADRD